MDNKLVCKGFQELTADEVMSVNGGGIFSSVLGIISNTFVYVTGQVSDNHASAGEAAGKVNTAAQSILKTIGNVGAWFGLDPGSFTHGWGSSSQVSAM